MNVLKIICDGCFKEQARKTEGWASISVDQNRYDYCPDCWLECKWAVKNRHEKLLREVRP